MPFVDLEERIAGAVGVGWWRMAASGDHLLFDACNGACQAAQPDGWGGSRAKNGVPGLSDGSVMLVVHRLAVIARGGPQWNRACQA